MSDEKKVKTGFVYLKDRAGQVRAMLYYEKGIAGRTRYASLVRSAFDEHDRVKARKILIQRFMSGTAKAVYHDYNGNAGIMHEHGRFERFSAANPVVHLFRAQEVYKIGALRTQYFIELVARLKKAIAEFDCLPAFDSSSIVKYKMCRIR